MEKVKNLRTKLQPKREREPTPMFLPQAMALLLPPKRDQRKLNLKQLTKRDQQWRPEERARNLNGLQIQNIA